MIDKIRSILDSIPMGDKITHCIVCLIISLLFGYFLNKFNCKYWYIFTFIIVFSIGLAKEFGDYMNPISGWSWGDIIANTLGILIAWLIFLF